MRKKESWLHSQLKTGIFIQFYLEKKTGSWQGRTYRKIFIPYLWIKMKIWEGVEVNLQS